MAVAPFSYTGMSPLLVNVCIRELNENPDQVNAHIESLRRWVRSMPHITCPLNSDFLIQFLRVSKFKHAKAQARLEYYCTVRGSPRGYSHWFKRMAPSDTMLEKILNLGQFLFLGISNDGEVVFLNRTGLFDPSGDIPLSEYLRVCYTVVDCLIELLPNMHTAGISILVDMAEVSLSYGKLLQNQRTMQDPMKVWKDAYPVRNKKIIYYREPVLFDVIFNVLQNLMKPKLRKRLYRVKDNLSKAYEIIPGLERLLPAEYGGPNGCVEDLKSMLKHAVQAYLARDSRLDGIRVEESKRPQS